MQYRIGGPFAAALMTSPAIAQTSSAAPVAKAPAAKASSAKPAKMPVVRKAKSPDCSKQADARSLPGKPRKSFMSGCNKAAG